MYLQAYPTTPHNDARLYRCRWRALGLALLLVFGWALTIPSGEADEISVPLPSAEYSIEVGASAASSWQLGQYEVVHLRDVVISQGNFSARSTEAILWIDRSGAPGDLSKKVVTYLEGDVQISLPAQSTADAQNGRMAGQWWLGRLFTDAEIRLPPQVRIDPQDAPPVYQRAHARWLPPGLLVQPAAYTDQDGYQPPLDAPVLVSPQTGQVLPLVQEPVQGQVQPVPQNLPPPGATVVGGGGTTRIDITQRSGVGASFRTIPGEVPGEQILIYTGGVRITIESPELATLDPFGGQATRRLDILADNVVAWSNALDPGNQPSGEARWEIYMEGNVVFATGQRTFYAERMFYDVNYRRGTILEAEMLTPLAGFNGLARLKADVVQQLDENRFRAHGALVTTSRLGQPRYWLQSQQVDIFEQPVALTQPFSRLPQYDPSTGRPLMEEHYFARSRNNLTYLGGIPIFYWPTFQTDLNDPRFYLKRLRIGNDNVFGFQVQTGWDLYQLLGIRNPPDNSEWIGSLDYLSERGVGYGTEFSYEFDSLFGIPGDVNGWMRAWFIDDHGLDQLGRGRRNLPPETDHRGRVIWRHLHDLPSDWVLRGEFGWISDRNFLEEYYEREWDTYKDFTTGIWLQRNRQNRSLNLNVTARLDDFVTETEWLPRIDHFTLGEPLLFGRAVWIGHSQIGYGRFLPLDAPTNPQELAQFTFLPWETSPANGIRAGTRQELDFPFQLGVVRVVPYVLGDATYWQEDLTGNELFRTIAQGGIRASLPMWRVDPTIQSDLLYLNGLAHKVTFDTELLYADASQIFTNLPLYDPLNDDSQEASERRTAVNVFGGAIPPQFDPRFYALRDAIQSNVTSPTAEIAGDLFVLKMGMRNRLQTKRGLPGEARVIDWVELDIGGSLFPKPDDDNFGSYFGLLDYDFSWHLGDRLSLVSDGFMDFFSQGLRTASVAVHMSRPAVGNLVAGFRTIEGPISSNVFFGSLAYRMSEKWILRGGSSYDFNKSGNIGQSISVIRVGESFLLKVGVNSNLARGNVGFVFAIEPRFFARSQLGRVGGMPLMPAGTEYIE